MDKVPTIVLEDLTPDERRAYILADNIALDERAATAAPPAAAAVRNCRRSIKPPCFRSDLSEGAWGVAAAFHTLLSEANVRFPPKADTVHRTCGHRMEECYSFNPTLGASQYMPRYSATVSPTASDKASQKLSPARSIAGKAKNIGIEGRKNQNAPCASCATRSVSPVSRHNHRNVSNETSGSDTISPPTPGQRLATSEAAATISPDRAAFRSR